MTVKAAVCDDDHTMCEYLVSLIKKECTDCQVDIYDSGSALLNSSEEYDLYFLDIQMSGINGMETARHIQEKRDGEGLEESVIIFITALKEYMADAFDVKAFHYLIKPIDEVKFMMVLKRALEDVYKHSEMDSKHMVIKSGNSYYKVMLNDIFYVESHDKKNILYTKQGAMEYYGKMQGLENLLGASFFRCHRSYIVNMDYIVQYNSDTIHLKNNDVVYIAQKKYHDFVKAYMRYVKSGGYRNGIYR